MLLLFCFRLKEVSDKISRHGYTVPPALQNLAGVNIQQLAVGPGFIALLLEVNIFELGQVYHVIRIKVFFECQHLYMQIVCVRILVGGVGICCCDTSKEQLLFS